MGRRWPGTRPQAVPDDPPGRDTDDAQTVAAQVLGDDPDPIGEADLSAEVGEWAFDDAEQADPAGDERTARQVLDDWLADRLNGGQGVFRAADLVDLRAQVDMSRSWVYDELNRRTSLGQLRRGDGTWTVVRAA